MKKIVAVFLSGMLVMGSLTACSNKQAEKPAGSSAESGAESKAAAGEASGKAGGDVVWWTWSPNGFSGEAFIYAVCGYFERYFTPINTPFIFI